MTPDELRDRIAIALYRTRSRIRPRGIHIYRYADNASPPLAGWNTYPGQTIGVWFRLPRHRILSLVWRRAR